MAIAVIDALRRFLPVHRRDHRRSMNAAQRRAAWAITHCRTAVMGGHLHACDPEFHFHSCNHPPSLKLRQDKQIMPAVR